VTSTAEFGVLKYYSFRIERPDPDEYKCQGRLSNSSEAHTMRISIQMDLQAEGTLPRQVQPSTKLEVQRQFRTLRVEFEAACLADFRLAVIRCKETVTATVREWIRVPGNVIPALFWFHRSALMAKIDGLLDEAQSRVDSSMAEFWAASPTDSRVRPHTAGRIEVLAKQFAVVSEPQFQSALVHSEPGTGLELRLRVGDFAHWMPPIVGTPPGLTKDTFVEWLGAYLGSLGYWATTQIALRDFLLHGGRGDNGLLDSIEEWAAGSEVRLVGELARGLEELGKKVREEEGRGNSVLRAHDSTGSDSTG
jgi:hypothetical protein